MPGDTNGILDLFIKDLGSGLVTRIDLSAAGIENNGLSQNTRFAFSGDSTAIVFESNASTLVPGDTNAATDIFVVSLTGGTAGDDVLAPLAAKEQVFGLAGDDRFLGSPLDDVFVPGTGRDHSMGGAGNDTFIVAEGDAVWAQSDIVALNSFMARSSDGKFDFTRIQGKLQYHDILDGGPGTDTVTGTDGADVLFLKSIHAPIAGGDPEALRIIDIEVFDLGGGDDVLDLTSTTAIYPNDVLAFGGPGNDYLWTGGGNDTLHGGPGADYLVGGPGDDIYYGNQPDGSGDKARDIYGISDIANAGTDRVMDFEVGFDKIRVVGFGKTHISQLDVQQVDADTVITAGRVT